MQSTTSDNRCIIDDNNRNDAVSGSFYRSRIYSVKTKNIDFVSTVFWRARLNSLNRYLILYSSFNKNCHNCWRICDNTNKILISCDLCDLSMLILTNLQCGDLKVFWANDIKSNIKVVYMYLPLRNLSLSEVRWLAWTVERRESSLEIPDEAVYVECEARGGRLLIRFPDQSGVVWRAIRRDYRLLSQPVIYFGIVLDW